MSVKQSEGGNAQSGGTLWAEGGVCLGYFDCVNDGQWLGSLALSVRSGSHWEVGVVYSRADWGRKKSWLILKAFLSPYQYRRVIPRPSASSASET